MNLAAGKGHQNIVRKNEYSIIQIEICSKNLKTLKTANKLNNTVKAEITV